MNALKRLIFCLSFCLFFTSTKGLAQTTDAQLWQGFAVEKKFNKKLSARFKDQIRLKNNFSTFRSNLFDTRVNYEVFNDYLRPSIGYRFTIFERKQKHRIYTDLRSRYKFENFPLRMALRLRYQNVFAKNEANVHTLRPRFSIDYKIKSLDIGFNANTEVFYDMTKLEKEFNQYRYSLGMSYDLSKRNQLNISYLYRRAFNEADPLTAHVLVLEFSVALSKKKKDKSK